MRAAFEESGFSVIEAENGLKAVALFRAHRPDLVVLDVVMPLLDGFEACAEMRRESALTPILMLTGLDDIDSINRAYAVGATDFATKPMNWVLLGHRLRYLLRSSDAMASVQKNKSRLETAQRIAQLGYWERERNSVDVRCSPEVHAILGTDPGTRTVTRAQFLALVHPEDRASFEEREGDVILSGEPLGFDFRVLRADGRVRYVRQETEVLRASDGSVIALAGTLQDITDRKEAEYRLSFLAHHDPLTRLPNRACLIEWLETRMERGRESGLAVLCFDVDRFSRINETMGRSVGDLALQRFGERLLNEALTFSRGEPGGGELMFAHAGGDKFLLGAVGLNRDEDVAVVARGMQAAMRHPFFLERRETFASVTAGLSRFPRDGGGAEELVANAESAVRHAKAEARGSFHFYSALENHQTARKLSVENGLRRAIERDELRLCFQPQIDTVRGDLVGVEALVRWQHPERGLVPPLEFIGVAEETGLIVPIGEWVLRAACEQMRALWRSGVPPFKVSVNLSPRQLRDKELIPVVTRVLERTGFPARYLDFEITETGMMGQGPNEVGVLQELKKLGASISVDDFGTGYSSLSYLTRLPIDTLKIDKTFIDDFAEESGSASIVKAIIAMAHSLSLTTVAEGVSSGAQSDLLRANGCHIVQGFHFGRPLPYEALEQWIAQRSMNRGAPGRPEPVNA
jgi:diguanylate cyclase (GGDEF)-like protein/PAS domain S-box-containing protein